MFNFNGIFTKTVYLKDALENCGVIAFVKDNSTIPDSGKFEIQHIQWCNKICSYLRKQGIKNATHGRVAKLISVYLRSMVVLQDLESMQSQFIHPPIDRILLQNIIKDSKLKPKDREKLKRIKWTQLGKKDYFEVIKILKEISGPEPFWKIEENWKLIPD